MSQTADSSLGTDGPVRTGPGASPQKHENLRRGNGRHSPYSTLLPWEMKVFPPSSGWIIVTFIFLRFHEMERLKLTSIIFHTSQAFPFILLTLFIKNHLPQDIS